MPTKEGQQNTQSQQSQNQQGEGLKYADEVIQKIAGIAASEVDGIESMSGGFVEGMTERLGRKSLAKGVKVEVGEKQVAIDLDVVVGYGVSIPDVYKEVKNRVQQQVTKMTGLEVIEVNMHVDDVATDDEENEDNENAKNNTESRVE